MLNSLRNFRVFHSVWVQASLVVALLGIIVSTTKLPAVFTSQPARTHVFIDGVDYGFFDQVEGLNELTAQIDSGSFSYTKLTLKRDFVTQPSLYLWAKGYVNRRLGLKDVVLKMKGEDGEELRFILKHCQPLSWTVEAANPAMGGFHEVVELAVQEIHLF